ncbi:hypothetical protein [Mycoplasmopsis arginini]|uniref:hypothetical protein n=1 Tax=Mycoplasmopsis arginini TaxID=2094 RepID=UPI003D004143
MLLLILPVIIIFIIIIISIVRFKKKLNSDKEIQKNNQDTVEKNVIEDKEVTVDEIISSVFYDNVLPKEEYSKVEDFFSPKEFLEREKKNIWVKRYYQVIEIMEKKGAIIGPYNEIRISDYYTNFKNEIGQWNYCRHHIDEIRISAQEFSSKESGMYEYYKISESILINFDQHLFLHYLIIMAKTTSPNDNMLYQLNRTFDDDKKSFEYWDNIIQKYCQEYAIPYRKTWRNNLKKQSIEN